MKARFLHTNLLQHLTHTILSDDFSPRSLHEIRLPYQNVRLLVSLTGHLSDINI